MQIEHRTARADAILPRRIVASSMCFCLVHQSTAAGVL
jgi:hypothetical protein